MIGNIHIPTYRPMIPHAIGSIIKAKLPTAICVPIIDGDFSGPKIPGVRKEMFGNTGPIPKPIRKYANVAAILPPGRINMTNASANIGNEIKIILQLPIFSLTRPAVKRPQVIPRK